MLMSEVGKEESLPSNKTHATMQTWAVLGASGMLGRAICRELHRRGHEVLPFTRDICDLTSVTSIQKCLKPTMTGVINCAAYTNVDSAEDEEELAHKINGYAVELLAKICAELNIFLVHYSTDYVFPGNSETPYQSNDKACPINAYGRSKLSGEEALRQYADRYILLRTSWVYAPWGHNFVRTMQSLGASRDSIRVVNDQEGRPTSALHLAEATLDLLGAGASGTYHLCDGGRCTWFEFAQAIMEESKLKCDVHPCTSEQYPQKATRPTWGVLDLSKTEELIGPRQHWRQWLQQSLQDFPHES
jgi:dTDP-4-dehydrorhamnose reductase